MRSTSVYHKVCKPIVASASSSVFHLLIAFVVNVTILSLYQHFNPTNNVSKSILSVSTASFLPAPTPFTSNNVLCLHVRNACRVRKVSLYISLSVTTSATLVNHIFHNVHHVDLQCVCVFLSLNCQLLRIFTIFFLDVIYNSCCNFVQ